MYQNGKLLLILLVFLSLFSFGCSKRDPNPELRDPIFLDLKERVGNLERDVNSFKATALDESEKEQSAEPNSKDLALAKKRLYEVQRKLAAAEQLLKFYEIKLERRKLETRLSYEKSLEEDKEWPNPKEYDAYLANKELKSAKSSWSTRVPKLKDRIQEFNTSQEAASNAPSGSH